MPPLSPPKLPWHAMHELTQNPLGESPYRIPKPGGDIKLYYLPHTVWHAFEESAERLFRQAPDLDATGVNEVYKQRH